MTAEELIVQVYEDTGESTDLCPYTDIDDETTFDVTTIGAQRILRLLNQAQVRIANWKFRDGSVCRFRGLMSRAYMVAGKTFSDTILTGSGNEFSITGMGGDVSGAMDGWLYEVTSGLAIGSSGVIINSVAVGNQVTLTLEADLGATPAYGDTVDFYKSFMKMVPNAYAGPDAEYNVALDPVSEVQDIIGIRDVTNGVDLEFGNFNEFFTGSIRTLGTPSQYRIFGNQIQFDVVPQDEITYEVMYVKHPTRLATGADVPDLPESVHEAIALWAVHNRQRKKQAFDKAYSTKREIEDLMSMVRQQGHFESEFKVSGLTIYG